MPKRIALDEFKLTLRVLITKEESEWTAHALEMDLMGTGSTRDEALQDLRNAIISQVEFARQQNKIELIDFPAERKLFDLWEETQRSTLRRLFPGAEAIRLNHTVSVLCIDVSEEILRHPIESRFKPVVCA